MFSASAGIAGLAGGLLAGLNKFVSPTDFAAISSLPLLLSAYEDFGPIFSLRLLHSRVVFMLGPEANHFVTVAQLRTGPAAARHHHAVHRDGNTLGA